MKFDKRAKLVIVLLIIVSALLSGCNEKDISEPRKEDVTEKSGTDNSSKKSTMKEMPIPKNREEQEELFGKTDKSGKFIPPEGSYTDQYGQIYNKYGVLIGGKLRKLPGGKG